MSNKPVEDRGDGRTVQLKGVRLAFTNGLVEKQAPPNGEGEPSFNFKIIVPTDSPHFEANKKKILSAMQAAGEAAWKRPDAWKQIAEDEPKRVCFRKGEKFKNDDGEIYGGFEGNWGLNTKGPKAGKLRPRLFDRYKRKVEEVEDIETVFYSGTFSDCVVSFYGTDKGGSKGIFASTDAIRSHQEGESLGGGGVTVTADDFDDLDDEGDSFGGESSGDDEMDLLG